MEQFLYEQLCIREIDVFFPWVRVRPANPRARKIRPYFPGYLFVLVDLATTVRPVLQWMPGAIGIVTFGGQPAEVPEDLLNRLRYHIDTLNARRTEVLQLFRPGDAITIQNGPFNGYEAIFDAGLPGRRRAQVLLSLIQGRSIKVELPTEHITARRIKFR